MPLQIIISFSFAVNLILWLRSRGKQLQGLLPPGPKPQPIVGNVFDFTLKEFWLRVTTWAEEYGDVIYLKIFNENLVFLNSVEAASDLLEKRGSIYSDRPQTTMGSELCGCDHIIAFAPYGHHQEKRPQQMRAKEYL
ncbi:hypothetical protein BC628DRAFT_251530 [Trametes gibbosa]|nr:hypothetical protein BC628DRAFT_251530 [Trametes gibbosa]